jgi:hypothetical protein
MSQDRGAAADAFFPTYAHLVTFAASYGMYKGEFDDDVEFVEGAPVPIPLEIFKNAGLYDTALVLTLKRFHSESALQSPESISKALEGFSSAGLRNMAKLDTGHDFLRVLVHEIGKVQGETKR